jgi:hypothetical protein
MAVLPKVENYVATDHGRIPCECDAMMSLLGVLRCLCKIQNQV